MKPIAIFQHDPLQHPGYLLQFLDEAGIASQVIRPCDGDDVPANARSFAGVVFLGSDDSVNDPFAWVASELNLARDAVARDVPVLGHCFGGQLLARALGAAVHRNPCPNIGWASLRTTPAARTIFGPASQVHAFNWHYESFGIPAGATRTLYGEHCLNKGFVFGPHLAFQGHFEVTEAIVKAWCLAHPDELARASGPAVQPAQQILTCLPERVAAVHVAARAAYSSWLAPMDRPARIHFQTA
ncbi:MAG: type 1 glutamine amidotransferase [Burkholderiales bacterium]|nr:type 1 glutamine amidotransferase [Burkholderiales bacterium]